jgi:hypothetical protein
MTIHDEPTMLSRRAVLIISRSSSCAPEALAHPSMSSPASFHEIHADAESIPFFAQSLPSSILSVVSLPRSTFPATSLVMKDISTTSYRSSRNAAYPKRRPSPSGISKHHKTPPLGPPPVTRRTPYSAKVVFLQQRQRQAQIAALRKQGIFLEEEYREDIRFYMHEMEVCTTFVIELLTVLILAV